MWSFFTTPYVLFRRIQDAIAADQLAEAQRLLAPLVEQGYRKAQKLQRELIAAHARRIERDLRQDDVDAAWAELMLAESLAGSTAWPVLLELRKVLTKDGLNEVAIALEAGNPRHAARVLSLLAERRVDTPQFRQYRTAAQAWLQAAEAADRGQFVAAFTALTPVQDLLETGRRRGLKRYEQELSQRREVYQQDQPLLTAAAAQRDWKVVVEIADRLRQVAPDDPTTRALRSQAWAQLIPGDSSEWPAMVSPPAATPENAASTQAILTEGSVSAAWSALGGVPAAVLGKQLTAAYDAAVGRDFEPTAPENPSTLPAAGAETAIAPGGTSRPGVALPLPEQFLLWIDNVGGYLVCTCPVITIGQATGDCPLHLPIYAPLSSLQAEIVREENGDYRLRNTRQTTIQDEPAEGAILQPGDIVKLGRSCEIAFRKSPAGSHTAFLEIISGHRMPWPVNGIILMDQLLVLGPNRLADIILPLLPLGEEAPVRKFVIFRNEDQLELKCAGNFLVDHRPYQERAQLPIPVTVVARPYAFSCEPIGPRV